MSLKVLNVKELLHRCQLVRFHYYLNSKEKRSIWVGIKDPVMLSPLRLCVYLSVALVAAVTLV